MRDTVFGTVRIPKSHPRFATQPGPCRFLMLTRVELDTPNRLESFSTMRRWPALLLFVALVSPSACISKLWKKEKDPTQKVFEVYGTVRELSKDEIVIQTKNGNAASFIMGPASIKGGDFGEGAYVHVYYKKLEEGEVVTMVVEKIG